MHFRYSKHDIALPRLQGFTGYTGLFVVIKKETEVSFLSGYAFTFRIKSKWLYVSAIP